MEDCRKEGHNPEKLSLLRVWVRAVPVARKISMIERPHDQLVSYFCLFGRQNYICKGHNHGKTSALGPDDVLCSGNYCKTKDLGLYYIIISLYYIFTMILNYRTMISFGAKKIDKKC